MIEATSRAGATGGRITEIARGMEFGLLTLLVALVFIVCNAGAGGSGQVTPLSSSPPEIGVTCQLSLSRRSP